MQRRRQLNASKAHPPSSSAPASAVAGSRTAAGRRQTRYIDEVISSVRKMLREKKGGVAPPAAGAQPY